MAQSPRLSLSYVAPSQAQKHVTVNETFRRLDALAQLSVLSRTTAAEPGAPSEGDAYILPASPTGAVWASYSEDDVAAFQDGAWVQIAPVDGVRAWVGDDNALVVYDGANWISVTEDTATKKFGVNASADATNRLSVKSDAILFSHDDVTPGNDDCIVKVNKKAAADTGSVVFQTNASGRAEFGLTGDDDFHVKVSPDNFSTTYEAIVIDKDNGNVGVGDTSPDVRLHVNSGATDVAVRFESTDANVLFEMVDSSTTTSGNGKLAIGRTGDNLELWAGGNQRVTVNTGVEVGSPTGGDKGAGTLNAQAVYDDNTLLTCYVFDQAIDGSVDFDKWDAKVPDRIIPARTEINSNTGEDIIVEPARREQRHHAPLRKFAARLGATYDPLTLDGYARHWKEKRHLTSMPNEATFDPIEGMAAGAWIQRLVETAEIQAVLIETLNSRVKSLEAKQV